MVRFLRDVAVNVIGGILAALIRRLFNDNR
jgi:hypothetical protein